MNKEVIMNRIEKIRGKMKEENVDLVIFSSSDFHGSEYVADYFKVTEYISGCTSDNVMILLLKDHTYLWTDARYFLSAEEELAGTGISLMKSGEPGVLTLNQMLDQILLSGMTLGYDGATIRSDKGSMFRQIAAGKNARVRGDFKPVDEIWTDRPAFPSGIVSQYLSEEEAGESVESKLERVRSELEKKDANAIVISKLDDIMWLFNIRGNDVPYNPVALSYCIISAEEAKLYIQSYREKELKEYAEKNNFTVCAYDGFYEDLEKFEDFDKVWLNYEFCSDRIVEILLTRGVKPVVEAYPTTRFKAIKNETELAGIRECYIADSVVLCRFLYYIQKYVTKERMTELSLSAKLNYMRSTISGYMDLSFATISAYGPNAAVIHYEPKVQSEAEIRPEGFYLVDSGGQYKNGTTDVTRTIALGKITDEMKRDFTYVAMANLRLLNARFLYGCTGANLDMYARGVLWQQGIDYKHGTGHGIGCVLNVHEGPQSIAWRILSPSSGKLNSESVKTVFEPGMITSDEPGIYRDGEYGIRIETVMECVEDSENKYGRFLSFKPLSYVPIDLNSMEVSLLEESDRKNLNAYHKAVYEVIAPHLSDPKELAWLKEATKEV